MSGFTPPNSPSSYVAKGLLPYHGLGSGIKRALEQWPQIDFVDDRDGCLFTATIHRKPVEQLELAGPESKTPVKTPDLVLQLFKERPDPPCQDRCRLSLRAFELKPEGPKVKLNDPLF